MRNLKRWFLSGSICAAMAIAGLTGCESSGKKAQGVPDDGKITHEVKERLKHEPAYKFTDVEVKTFDRVVQLTGFVTTPAQKQRAEQLARSVYGVSSVVNNIALVHNPELTPTGKMYY